MSATSYQQAKAAWRAAKAASASSLEASLPPALQADLQALRAAGLACTIVPSTPAPPPRPARVMTMEDVAMLDARDPMRTLYQYQRAYSVLGQPVPQHLVESLRHAMRDEQISRRKRAARFATS